MIELRLLGTVTLADADGRPVRSLLTQPRRLALLAYLAAATPRGMRRRDHLLPLFWPELDQARARAALRQALHVLRTELGPEALTNNGEEEIGLDGDRFRCDVSDFDGAMAARQFETALELYRGPLLDGFFIPDAPEFERWLETERARLQDAASRAARTLAAGCEEAGDLPAAAQWTRRAARLTPLDESLARALIRLLDRMGDRAGALVVYHDFARRLATELDAQPAPETQALIAAVRVRQTVAGEAVAPPAIETVTRPQTSEGEFPSGVSPPESRRRKVAGRGARIALWAGAAVLGALAILTGFNVGGWRDQLLRAEPSTRMHSLAVLPLENLSGDSTGQALVEGMTSALTTDLAEVRTLRVMSRRASDRFRGSSMDARQIGDSLRVDALVEGGLAQSQGRLRVDLQLIDARTGEQLWARQFEGRLEDRFGLEDEISRGVLSALRVSGAAAGARRSPPTSNLAAYDLYLRGKNRALLEDRQNDSIAIVLLEQAVTLDPSFAAAYAELAHAYGIRASQFVPGDPEIRDRAAVAVAKALDLNPNLAEGHYVRAFLLWGPGRRFPHELSIAEDRRALALNPNLPRAHFHLGMVLLHIGLLDEAVAELQQTLALDPGEGFAQQRLGIAQVYQGRYEEGLRTFQAVGPAFNPSFWHYQVAWALLYLGRDEEALDLIEKYLRENPQDPGGIVTAARAILFAKRGDARRAEADIQKAIAIGSGFQHFHHTAYSIAMSYALMHRPEPAVRFLRQAASDGLPCYPCFANDPYLASLRGDRDFDAFMRGLKEQWGKYRAAYGAATPASRP